MNNSVYGKNKFPRLSMYGYVSQLLPMRIEIAIFWNKRAKIRLGFMDIRNLS